MTNPLFATHGGAYSHALRLAQRNSADGLARKVEHTDAVRANDGTGAAYVVRPAHGGRSPDYEVIELTEVELRDMVRRGMLRKAEDLEAGATENEREADDLRVSGKQRQRMERLRKQAADDFEEAARLRVRATGLGLVNAVAGEDERKGAA